MVDANLSAAAPMLHLSHACYTRRMNWSTFVTMLLPVLALGSLIMDTVVRASIVRRAGHPLPFADRHGDTHAARVRSNVIIYGTAAGIAIVVSTVLGIVTA